MALSSFDMLSSDRQEAAVKLLNNIVSHFDDGKNVDAFWGIHLGFLFASNAAAQGKVSVMNSEFEGLQTQIMTYVINEDVPAELAATYTKTASAIFESEAPSTLDELVSELVAYIHRGVIEHFAEQAALAAKAQMLSSLKKEN